MTRDPQRKESNPNRITRQNYLPTASSRTQHTAQKPPANLKQTPDTHQFHQRLDQLVMQLLPLSYGSILLFDFETGVGSKGRGATYRIQAERTKDIICNY